MCIRSVFVCVKEKERRMGEHSMMGWGRKRSEKGQEASEGGREGRKS